MPKRTFGNTPFVICVCNECHEIADRLIGNDTRPIECAYIILSLYKYGLTAELYLIARRKMLEWHTPSVNR